MPAGRKLFRVFIAVAITTVLLPARALGSDDSVEFEVFPGPVGYGAGPDNGAGPPGIPSATPLGRSDRPQPVRTRLAPYGVIDASGSGGGWNITVSGEEGREQSPVLAQYCPSASCGRHRGPGYVPDGITLPTNSLTLDSSGARFRGKDGGSGDSPANTCGQGCFIDTPSRWPSKIAVAHAGTGMGAFEASGFSASSVRLVEPSSPEPLPKGEIYRVDVSWSLNTGP
jgi:hypothetical protein